MKKMKCPHCEKEIPTDSKFCPHCGMHISPDEVSVFVQKKKPRFAKFIFILCLLVFFFCVGYYFWTYSSAKRYALEGEYEKAQESLIFPGITGLHDDNLVSFLYSVNLLKSTDDFGTMLSCFKIIKDLNASSFSPAGFFFHQAQEILYSHAQELYNSGNTIESRSLFSELDTYKNASEYLRKFEESDKQSQEQEKLFGEWHSEDDSVIISFNESSITKFITPFCSGRYISYVFDKKTCMVDYTHLQLNEDKLKKGGGLTAADEFIFRYRKNSTNYEPLFSYNFRDDNTITVICEVGELTVTLYRQ